MGEGDVVHDSAMFESVDCPSSVSGDSGLGFKAAVFLMNCVDWLSAMSC